MSKLRIFYSPSFLVGLVVSVSLILLTAHLFLYSIPHFTLEGITEYTTRSFLEACPWLVIIGGIAAAGLTLLGDLYYRTVMTSHRVILTGLQAIITPIAIMAILFKIAPSEEIEPDIPAIQEHLFGEHGDFLKGAEKITLFSTHIDPYKPVKGVESPELFHGHEVYGSINIQEPKQIEALWKDLQSCIHWNMNCLVSTCCFWPRHGLRAYRGNEIRDYLICFQCSQLHIFTDVHSENSDYIKLESGATGKDTTLHFLNGILDKAGIERDRSNR